MLKLSVLDQSPIRHGCTPAQALQETVELARRTDALGYTRYWLAEHHSSGGLAGSAPEILIDRVLGETQRLRVGSGGVMLSHYSALKVAESFRVLEALHPGRVDLGIGRAPGSDRRTAMALAHGPGALGIEHFPAQIEDLIGYLRDDLPPDHPFRGVHAMPAGPTMPELWMLGSSGQSAAYAAYFGCPFSFAHFINPHGGDRVMQAYREQFRPSVLLAEPQGSVGVFVICAETEEAARRLELTRRLWLLRLYRGETGPVPTEEEAESYRYTESDELLLRHARGRTLAGTPEQCRAGLTALASAYGVDELVIVTICPEFETRVRSYELLAEAFGLEGA